MWGQRQEADDEVENIQDGGVNSIQDVYLSLIYDLDVFSKKILEVKELAENQRDECGDSFIAKTRSHKMTHRDTLTHYKNRYAAALGNSVNIINHIAEPTITPCCEQELKDKLVGILEEGTKLMTVMTEELERSCKRIDEIKHNQENLQNMTQKLLENTESGTDVNWETVQTKIRQKRAFIIKDFRIVLDELGKDTDINDILSVAMEARQSGDLYVEVEKNWRLEDIEFLLRCNLLSRHPHDKLKVRIVDIL